MLPLETQLCQPALPGGHKLQGGTRDTLPGVPAPQRATIIPVPFSLPALSPPASPSLGGQEPQVPAALPAGSLCMWGDRPQPCHGWDSRTGTPQAQYAQRRQHRAAALRLPGIAPGSSPQGQSIQHTHPYPGTKPPPATPKQPWGVGVGGGIFIGWRHFFFPVLITPRCFCLRSRAPGTSQALLGPAGEPSTELDAPPGLISGSW